MKHDRSSRSLTQRLRLCAAVVGAAGLAVGCGGGSTGTVTPAGPIPTTPPTGATATPTAVPSGATPVPTGTPTVAPTAKPTATPTAAPTATPTVTPTTQPTVSPQSCVAAIGGTYYDITLTGNVPAAGTGAFTSTSATYIKLAYVAATPTPTPAPTLSPSPTPTPTLGPTPTPAPNRPGFIYTGTYHIASATAPTDGCFTAITTADGAPFSNASYNASGFGAVTAPANSNVQFTGNGTITSVTLNLAAPGSGTMTLDNGDTGSFSIVSSQAINAPLSRSRR